MSSRGAKRRNSSSSEHASKKQRGDPGDDEAAWGDIGSALEPDGTISHDIAHVSSGGFTITVRVGDAIFLRSDDDSDSETMPRGATAFVARVERMWEEPPKKRGQAGRMMMQARWYFKKQDLVSLGGGDFVGPISREELLASMTDHDLVLSNQFDNNEVLTVMGKCSVVRRRPSKSEVTPPLPQGAFVSRYSISFGSTDAPGTAIISAYDGDNGEWPTEDSMDVEEYGSMPRMGTVVASPSIARAHRRRPSNDVESHSSSDESSRSDGSSSFSQEQDRGLESEGKATKGILVGKEHQVAVPPFTEPQPVTSRNPTLVWEPVKLPQGVLDGYLVDASKILKKFLEQHDLLPEEHYAPLPSARMEAMVQAEHAGERMTLSHVSTGSTLSENRNKLTRECDVDALLATLHEKNYDPKEALKVIEASPRDYLTIWSHKDKDLFNNGFRRHSGSLRAISKALSSTHNFKDVVDYHYRFKIPDQFRRYQEKKREQAVRMMECVEHRRSYEAPILARDDFMESRKAGQAKKTGEWHKSGIATVTGAVEERRVQAKELFLQVQNDLGTEQMAQLASAVKSLKDGSIEDIQETFSEVLREHPDLLEKFMGFLPRSLPRGRPRKVY